VGTTLFKSGRLAMALQRYKMVSEIFNHIDKWKDENKVKAKELKHVCELNKAACYLKMAQYVEAKKACDDALKEKPQNVKALYRRAQALLELKEFGECIRDCKTVVGIDPQNKDARALLKKAQLGQKEVDKQAKGLFANMCKALGKGPIPEPGRTKQTEEDDEDMDEEADMKLEAEDVANAKQPDVEMPDAAAADSDAKMPDAAATPVVA